MLFKAKIPQITPEQLSEKQKSPDQFVLMDVREQNEFDMARIEDPRACLVPMTILANKGIEGLPDNLKSKSTEIVVFCHLGSRSIQVVNWMQQNGWENVWNMSGGIDAYARKINPEIRRY